MTIKFTNQLTSASLPIQNTDTILVSRDGVELTKALVSNLLYLVPASGDVTGPASATDNGIARFNGTTGKLIEDSMVLISTDGNLSGNSNTNVPTEQAVKSYVDNFSGNVYGPASSTNNALALFNGTTGKIIKDSAVLVSTDVAGQNSNSFVPTNAAVKTYVDNKATQSIYIAASDETTALTTGTAKVTFRMPYAFTLTGVRASVTTAPTGSTLIVDINEGGTSVLGTKLSIDATEKSSFTAASVATITNVNLADDSEITIDIDQIGSTVAGAGLKVYLIGVKV